MKLTSVTSWLTSQLKLPFKNEYPAHLDASPLYFHAHLRFLIRHNFLAGRQAKFTTRPEHVAPWAWSCISSRTTPEPPRPFQIIQESDIRHRDRSKKYICSYLWTGPDRASTRIGEKSSKITKISTFSIFYEPFAPWLLPQRHRTINNAQNIHFFLVISIGHPTTRIWS